MYLLRITVIMINICTFTSDIFAFIEKETFSKELVSKFLNDPLFARTEVNRITNEELEDVYLDKFLEFTLQYNRIYDNDEEHNYRFRIFCENMLKIEILQKIEMGTATYGPNKFADISGEEFRAKYFGLIPKWNRPKALNINMQEAEIPNERTPSTVDWRDKHAVTDVKNQGECGSCYAFSVTGNVEGQVAIKTGKLTSFSEQEIVDCDELDAGCDGGLMQSTYTSILKLGGLATEKDYPYLGKVNKCKLPQTKISASIKGYLNISADEEKIAKWVAQKGPASVSINAVLLQHYIRGIQYLPGFICNPEDLNHAMLIVGFGEQKTILSFLTIPYWIIKNSWGTDWGEQGYYRMFKGSNMCGIATDVSSAIL